MPDAAAGAVKPRNGSVQMDARLAEGLRLQQQGATEEAAQLFLAVLDQFPQQAAALYSMAVIEQAKG